VFAFIDTCDLPRNLLHVMQDTNKQCGYAEMFDTTPGVTGLLQAVTEKMESCNL
jgi:hypothetical protein